MALNALNPLDEKACYAAFAAHDARFDGRVYVCVASTGIYCRPVCRVRMPREANCTFQPSAAAAEAAGFRPCRKCRPELAPGYAPVDATARLARQACLLIEDDGFRDRGIPALADALGVSDRHLRRVFEREFGVAPVQYLLTRRLLLAKSLLADTPLPITRIAFAAGFESIRRFNDAFKRRYRSAPSTFRQHEPARGQSETDGITLRLGYRPPYGWDSLAVFLGGRAIPGVEAVTDGVYRRTASVREGTTVYHGWIAVRHEEKKRALAVTLSPALLPVIAKVLARVRNLFDLDCDPDEIAETLSCMNAVKPGLFIPGTRLPGCFDGFEMAVRAVLGQQITVKAARTLAARFARAFGAPVPTPFAELTHAFPTPEAVCGLDGPVESHLGPLGIIRARARSILALATAMRDGHIALTPSADPVRETDRLLALPGFGQWTTQYIAMRALGWPDAFPHTDYGVKKALDNPPPADILALAESWRPWRSYATVNLWNSLRHPDPAGDSNALSM